MSAIKRAKIYAEKRTRLEEVIPLAVPFSVQIDVCSACNMRCDFCVHSDIDAVMKAGIQWGVMSLELFRHIVDDMKNAWGGVKIKKLRLFQIGEPLLNPHICEMIAYAKKQDIAEFIEITTNATLLNKTLSDDLICSGLDILNISLNGINEEQYRNVCHYEMKYEKFRENIAYFYQNKKNCRVFIKYSDIGYSDEEKERFFALFEDICDEIFVETISATLWQDTNVSEKIPNAHIGTYGQELVDKKVCPFLFTTLIINDKGIAHLCCADWKMQYKLGDLSYESVSEIWNGEQLRRYQILHLSGDKDKMNICRKCESLSANNIDNIDAYAEELLHKIEKS